MSTVLLLATILVFVWSALQYQAVHDDLIAARPWQFPGGLSSWDLLPVVALSPSTPLSLQAAYVEALGGGCLTLLCLSLLLFSSGEALGGWLALGGSLMMSVSIFQSWKTYRANCNRSISNDDGEES